MGINWKSLIVNAAGSNLKISSIVCKGADTIEFKAQLPSNAYGSYKIYRATVSASGTGKLKLLDEFPCEGNGWFFDSSGIGTSDGNRNKITCISSNRKMAGTVSFIDSGVKLGNKYIYQIVHIDTFNEKKVYSNKVSCKSVLGVPTITKGYASSNTTAKLVWSNVKAKGYEVYRYDGKKWKRVKTITKATTTSYTNTKLKSGKTYKYKIRSYSTLNGLKVYSKFSKVCSIK